MQETTATMEKTPAKWRMGLALALIVTSLCSAVFIPVVVASGLSVELKTTLSGLLVFGIPQILMLGAVALVGKSGFNYLKGRIFGAAKGIAPAQTVGRTRYRIGLVMFFVPVLIAMLGPYLSDFVSLVQAERTLFAVISDISFLASFFVLGGDFWDKLRALFTHQARA